MSVITQQYAWIHCTKGSFKQELIKIYHFTEHTICNFNNTQWEIVWLRFRGMKSYGILEGKVKSNQAFSNVTGLFCCFGSYCMWKSKKNVISVEIHCQQIHIYECVFIYVYMYICTYAYIIHSFIKICLHVLALISVCPHASHDKYYGHLHPSSSSRLIPFYE